MRKCPACVYPNPDSRVTCFKCGAVLDAQAAATADPSAAPAPTAAPGTCEQCGLPAEEGYAMSFCKDCRTKLANTPLPGWVRASLIVVVAMLIYAFAQFPSSVSAGIAFEKGKRAEAASNYSEAVTQYKIVVERFPESTLAIARLGLSQWHAHDLPGAVDTLQKLEGRKAPDDELYDEVNQAMHQIEAEIKLRMKR